MFKVYLFFHILILSGIIKAVVTRVDQLQGTGECTKKYFLYSIIHTASRFDEPQFNILKKALLSREYISNKEMDILIEKPCFINIFQDYKSVPTLLDKDKEIKSCKKTTIENVEIRAIAIAILFLMSADPYNVMPEIEFTASDHKCRIGEITLKNAEEEFTNYAKKIRSWAEALTNNRRMFIQPYLDQLTEEWDCFHNINKLLSIPYDQPILNFAKQTYYSDPDSRKILSQSTSNLFSLLFELHILKHIHSIHKPEVMIISGADHIDTIRTILLKFQHNFVKSYGSSLGPEPLNFRYLDIFNQSQKCYNMCPIHLQI